MTQPDAPQPARVGVSKLAAVVEGEAELGEARGPGAVGIAVAAGDELDAAALGRVEAPGHPEVEDGPRPPVKLEPEVLAVPPHRLHAASQQGPPEAGGGDAVEDDRIVSAANLRDDPARGHPPGDDPPHLDLGQLRHRFTPPTAPPAITIERRA